MAISIKQYQYNYNRFLLEILKEGKVPTFEDVVQRAGNRLPSPDRPATPGFEYIPQSEGSVFDIINYNKAVDNILSDLKILFSELTDIEIASLQRMLYADLYHNVHSYELKKLDKKLDSLLFTLQGADDNFFSSNENFTDTTNVDLDVSTPNVVDTHEGALSLPIGRKGTKKISLSHLYDTANANVTLSPATVLSKGNVPGTAFSNIFKDSGYPWGLLLESDTNGPVSVSFTFKLQTEEFINRITLIHHGDKPQTVFISTSVDNYNKKQILEYASGVKLSDQGALVSLDFADTLTEYVHVTLAKSEADSSVTSDNATTFQYTFGLKNISLYISGRAETATYQSKPFDFGSDLDAIGKISISVDESIPVDTNIQWFVAMANDAGEVSGSLMPITPESRSSNSGPPKIISVQDTITNSRLIVSSSDTYANVMTFSNIDFYSISTLDSEPIFGTAKLYRGGRSWFRDSQGNFNPLQVKDNFIPFSKGDVQNLYTISQEVVLLQGISSSLEDRVCLLNNTPLYQSSKGHFLVPPFSLDTNKDTAPNYAIYSAALSVGPVATVKTGVTFSSSNESLGQPNIVYKTKADISIKDVIYNPGAGQVTGQVVQEFVDGIDYIVELDSNSYPTGKILLTNGSKIANGPLFNGASRINIYYTIDDNITRFISDIKNGQIFFKFLNTQTLQLLTNQQVTIKYRYVPSNVIKSSIKVKASFGNSPTTRIYRQGIDYIFDTGTGTVQRLTTGTIPSNSDIFIDYKFNDTSKALHQFFMWAYVSDVNGKQIEVKTLGANSINDQTVLMPDKDRGESVSANIPGLGVVDLTSAILWPKLKGWVQFIVKSIPPEELINSSKTSLIEQVILLKDRNNDYIFVQGGKYFNELTAIRDPMQQVSLPYLKTNILKDDHSKFAIRSQLIGDSIKYQAVVNFQPNETEELYSFSADVSSSGMVSHSEEWKLVWISRESQSAFTRVIVKAILSRASNLDGNITPKVMNYYLKIGY